MKPITVLIVEDSAFMRRTLRRILEGDPKIRVVGTARNGEDGVSRARQLQPDVVCLDINMPVMDGLTALQYIMAETPRACVMISSLTQEGAVSTFEALELGAVDYVPKPSGTISLDIRRQEAEIIAKVKAAASARLPGKGRARKGRRKARPVKRASGPSRGSGSRQVVAIGVSTGGPRTLMEILPDLPADLPAAVLIVQHMPENFTGTFAKRLNQYSPLTIKEAARGDEIKAGHGYLAPGGRHMTVRAPSAGQGASQSKGVVRLSPRPTDVLHRPSVDVLFDSVVRSYGAQTVGVLLTGMGDDGADGMVKIRRAGGYTIAEDESTAVVFGMPAQAIARGGADKVLPSFEVAEEIIKAVGRGTTLER